MAWRGDWGGGLGLVVSENKIAANELHVYGRPHDQMLRDGGIPGTVSESESLTDDRTENIITNHSRLEPNGFQKCSVLITFRI